jgi:cytidine deaminase
MPKHANEMEKPEIVIGLVGAIGTKLDVVKSALKAALSEVGYESNPIRVIYQLKKINKWRNLGSGSMDERYTACMDAGNEFREMTGMGDALAVLAIGAIRRERKERSGDADRPIANCAHLLHSLKTPHEVETLRKIYGPAFILVAAYSPTGIRVKNLAAGIAESHQEFHTGKWLHKAEELIQRDQRESEKKFGQNVRETFWRADVFIDASQPLAMQSSIQRFIRLLFGNTFETPTRDEYCMFHAKAAALRSASLSRQVGAVIATAEGGIIAVGTNEVPKAGGGLYWAGNVPDNRDFVWGYDSSERMRRKLLGDVLNRLRSADWFVKGKDRKDVEKLVTDALEGPMKGAKIMDLIEFGRTVHAEMAAIVEAARHGARVQGCTLYTTTFPCHDCAKHIVAAGISRVVYIEPYPKSLTPELYPDSIAIDSAEKCGSFVQCEAFVGVAPPQYINLFTMSDRKDDKTGSVSPWDPHQAQPRVGVPPSYQENEKYRFKKLLAKMKEKRLNFID